MRIGNTSKTSNQGRTDETLKQSPNVTFTPPPDIAAGFAQLTGKMGEMFGKYANEQLKIKNRTQIDTEKTTLDNEVVLFGQNYLRDIQQNKNSDGTSSAGLIDPNSYVEEYDKQSKIIMANAKKNVRTQTWAEHSGKLELNLLLNRNKVIEYATAQVRTNAIVTTNKAIEIGINNFDNILTSANLKLKSVELINLLEDNKNVFTPEKHDGAVTKIEEAYVNNQLRITVGSSAEDQLSYLLEGGVVLDVRGDEIKSGDVRYNKLLGEMINKVKLENEAKGTISVKANNKEVVNINKVLEPLIGSTDVNEVIKIQNDLVNEVRNNSLLSQEAKEKRIKQIKNYFLNTEDNERIAEFYTTIAKGGGIKGSLLDNFEDHAAIYLTATRKASILKINKENLKVLDANQKLIRNKAYKVINDALGGDEDILSILDKDTKSEQEVQQNFALFRKTATQEQINALNLLVEVISNAKNKGIPLNELLTRKHDFFGNGEEYLTDAIVKLAQEENVSDATLNDIVLQKDTTYNDLFAKKGPDGQTNYFYVKQVKNEEGIDVGAEILKVDLGNTIVKNLNNELKYLNIRREGEPIEAHLDRIAFYTTLANLHNNGITLTNKKIDEIAENLGFDSVQELKQTDMEATLSGLDDDEKIAQLRQKDPNFTGYSSEDIDEIERKDDKKKRKEFDKKMKSFSKEEIEAQKKNKRFYP